MNGKAKFNEDADKALSISQIKVTFYSSKLCQGCFHSQCVFKYRAWNLIIINSPAAKSEPKYLFILILTKHRISIVLKRFLIRSVSNWSKDSSKLKFRMISSDEMDSNDLWAQRNDSTSSLFWKSDYKTTAKKLFVISFTFLSNLQVPQFQSLDSAVVNQTFWTRTSGPSKAPEVRSYDRQLATLVMVKYSLKNMKIISLWKSYKCWVSFSQSENFHFAWIEVQ